MTRYQSYAFTVDSLKNVWGRVASGYMSTTYETNPRVFAFEKARISVLSQ